MYVVSLFQSRQKDIIKVTSSLKTLPYNTKTSCLTGNPILFGSIFSALLWSSTFAAPSANIASNSHMQKKPSFMGYCHIFCPGNETSAQHYLATEREMVRSSMIAGDIETQPCPRLRSTSFKFWSRVVQPRA